MLLSNLLQIKVNAMRQRCLAVGLMPSAEMIKDYCELIVQLPHFSDCDDSLKAEIIENLLVSEELAEQFVEKMYEQAQEEMLENADDSVLEMLGQQPAKEFDAKQIKF